MAATEPSPADVCRSGVGAAEAVVREEVGQRYTESYNRVADDAWTERVSGQTALHRATYYVEARTVGLVQPQSPRPLIRAQSWLMPRCSPNSPPSPS